MYDMIWATALVPNQLGAESIWYVFWTSDTAVAWAPKHTRRRALCGVFDPHTFPPMTHSTSITHCEQCDMIKVLRTA